MTALKLVTQGSPCKHIENVFVFKVWLIWSILSVYKQNLRSFCFHWLQNKVQQEIRIWSDKCIASFFHSLSMCYPVFLPYCALFFFFFKNQSFTRYLPLLLLILEMNRLEKIIFQEEFCMSFMCFETASNTSIISVLGIKEMFLTHRNLTHL